MQYRKSGVSHDRDALIKQFGLVFNNRLQREVGVSLTSVNKVELLPDRTSGVPPVIFSYDRSSSR